MRSLEKKRLFILRISSHFGQLWTAKIVFIVLTGNNDGQDIKLVMKNLLSKMIDFNPCDTAILDFGWIFYSMTGLINVWKLLIWELARTLSATDFLYCNYSFKSYHISTNFLLLTGRSEPGIVPSIVGFTKDSVALESDRLAPGDRICSVNGISTARLTNDEVLRLLDNVEERASLEVEYYMPNYGE